MDLAEAVDGIVSQLTAAGVRSTADPRDVNPPCVLVQPPTLDFEFGKTTFSAAWSLWAIVPDTGRLPSLRAVSDLITATEDALGWKAVDARPDDVLLNDGASCPMYVLTFTERFTK